MTNLQTELERWLAGEDIFGVQSSAADIWSAGFDAERQVVVAKLGPYQRLFLRPQKFSKRFYHQIYPLSIEHWPHQRQYRLFDDFCSVDINLDLRFQATLPYVLINSELLPVINQHIRESYRELLDDIFSRELPNLEDGVWVQTGLADMEKRISVAACELLAIQQIQSQASCTITARFETFPNVTPGPNNVYLHVMKQSFEITDQQNREAARQQQLHEQQALAEKQQHFDYLQQLTELELQEQSILAEKDRRLLEDKADQLARQLAIEKRIHDEQLRHDEQLKQIQLDSDLRLLEQQQSRHLQQESQQLTEQLTHEAEMADRKIVAEIQRRENVLFRQRQGETVMPDNIQS